MSFKRAIFLMLYLLVSCATWAQTCPENIGFEDGTFKNYQCYASTTDRSGSTAINWGLPIANGNAGQHTILPNTSPQALDPYGHFPVNSPNGSKFSLMLGNSSVSGGQGGLGGYCERVTYDFVVPTDDFTMIYYYAVVFQNPRDHDDFQQPKFIANVVNLDDPTDTPCGSFAFTSSAGLQGFQRSDVGADVYYKAWSPITIKLTKRKGKHYQLEFITRDCSKGGHFGYAYLDFNENCASPITGNNYCAGAGSQVVLTAPAGFEHYSWTSNTDTAVLSTSPTLKISPIPPDGTTYSLHIIPYTGLGCENIFTSVIHQVNEPFQLKVLDSLAGCKADGINLKDAMVTAGSSPGMTFTYYTDPDGQNFLSDPKLVKKSGDYYIRGSNDYGCTDIAKIHLDLYDGPAVTIKPPVPVCFPATIDLTKAVTTNDKVEYYSDAALKTLVPNPKVIDKTGLYYVKATRDQVKCVSVSTINVIISDLPQVIDKVLEGCPPLNLNSVTSVTDNAGGISYSFYTDASGKTLVTDPTKITVSGTYYYQATNLYGCTGNIAKIEVTVYPVPVFKVIEPQPVVFPQTVSLVYTHIPLSNVTFTYWEDAACTKPLADYQSIGVSGTFYVKATNATGCTDIHPVHVQVNAPPEPDLLVGNTFTPNGDGINDEFRPAVKGVVRINYLKIYNRYGKEIFTTNEIYNRWNGTLQGKPEPVGTYYWVFSAFDLYRKKDYVRSGSITIVR